MKRIELWDEMNTMVQIGRGGWAREAKVELRCADGNCARVGVALPLGWLMARPRGEQSLPLPHGWRLYVADGRTFACCPEHEVREVEEGEAWAVKRRQGQGQGQGRGW